MGNILPLREVGAPAFCWVPTGLGNKNVLCEVADPWVMLCMNAFNRGNTDEPTHHHHTEPEASAPSVMCHSPLAPFDSVRLAVLPADMLGLLKETRHALMGNVASFFYILETTFCLRESKIALKQTQVTEGSKRWLTSKSVLKTASIPGRRQL